MPSLEKMAEKARAKPKSSSKSKTKEVAAKKVAKQPLVESFKSKEFILSSDDEKASSDSEEEVEKPKAAPVLKPKEDSSSSEEESDSEERDESEDEMDVDSPAPPPASILKKPTPSEPSKQSTRPLAPPPKLPAGFKSLSTSSSNSASTLFKPSNLKGKQIWYFTAPSSIPVSALQKVSLKEGNSISHGGSTYTFAEGTVAEGKNVYVAGGEGYSASTKPISKTLHLQLLSLLPGVTTTGPSPTATIPAAKPVRPQPKGMKMRFFPIGVAPSASAESESESEDDDKPTTFQVPAAIEDSDVEVDQQAPSLKRKHATKDEEGEKRVKKRKTVVAVEGQTNEEVEVSKKEKKSKKNKIANQQPSTTTESTKADDEAQETKEEKRRRKKEKKERRAAA